MSFPWNTVHFCFAAVTKSTKKKMVEAFFLIELFNIPIPRLRARLLTGIPLTQTLNFFTEGISLP
jgi:hypothetical protein